MATDAQNFKLSLAAFAANAPDKVRVVVRKVAIDLQSQVVLGTPVGNPDLWESGPPKGYVGGRLRANWNVSLVSPDTSTTQSTDAGGQTTISRGAAVIADADGVKDIFIMNSLPYAIPVEYGHSKQSPAGMVRINVANF